MREEKPALGNQDFGGLIQEELQSSSSKASVVPRWGEAGQGGGAESAGGGDV